MLIAVSILFLGALIGSFLNVMIYRLPLGISLSYPKRSYCPRCQRTLCWWENIPIMSWLFLRARCSGCRGKISFRYPLVEAVTGFLFLSCYLHFGWSLVVPFSVFVSLLIVATFIDLEHLMIPDMITLGGIIAGIGCSFLQPALMKTDSSWSALFLSAANATAGYLLLWSVVELGKMAFGKHKISFEKESQLELLVNVEGQLPLLTLQDEKISLKDLLLRSSDQVSFFATSLTIGGEELSQQHVIIRPTEILLKNKKCSFAEALPLSAAVKEITLPREAMGFGDVKFLACIGAFLGWKGMIFSLLVGSLIGAMIGVTLLLATRGKKGRLIPFGPYLALGALLWMFFGSDLLMKWPGYSF